MAEQKEVNRLRAVVREYQTRLREGHDYLMSVDQGQLSVEDALHAFGWESDGVTVRDEPYTDEIPFDGSIPVRPLDEFTTASACDRDAAF